MVNAEPPLPIKAPRSTMAELPNDPKYDSSSLDQKARMRTIERHRSCEVSQVTLSELELDGFPARHQYQTLEVIKSGGTPRSSCSPCVESTTDTNALNRHTIADSAWEALKQSIVYFRGQPIGTVAALDKSQSELNYDQVFMRDFVPSALAFLMKGEPTIVRNFLLETAHLQSREKMVDLFKLGQGVMPASFKVHHSNPTQKTETLLADFGEIAIGRVAPVDSGLWWIFLLRAYTKWTKDNSLAESPHCQTAMRLILKLWLSEGFDTSPALLCADGCSMIDRRMGIYGYPIEIQALFFMALRCALSFLKDSNDDFVCQMTKRIKALSYHLHSYYWFDFQRLNDIYHYKTEEYSQTALNKFNVIPESIPDWIYDFMPSRGGYFIGNDNPTRMDFYLSSLATGEQAEAILDVVEDHGEELIGEMPLKICYPAMENQEWQILTGCDQKNTRWSYRKNITEDCPHHADSQHGDEIVPVFIRHWGSTLSLQVRLDDPAEFLLQTYKKRTGITCPDLYFVYCGKVIDLESTLRNSGVGRNSTIDISAKLRGGMLFSKYVAENRQRFTEVKQLPDQQFSLNMTRCGCRFLSSLVSAFTYTFSIHRSWNGSINWDQHFKVIEGMVRIFEKATDRLNSISMTNDAHILIQYIENVFLNTDPRVVGNSKYPPYFRHFCRTLRTNLSSSVLGTVERMVIETHICVMESYDRLMFTIMLKRKYEGLLSHEKLVWERVLKKIVTPHQFNLILEKVPLFKDIFNKAVKLGCPYSDNPRSAFRLLRDFSMHTPEHKNIADPNAANVQVEKFKDDDGVELMVPSYMADFFASLVEGLILAKIDIARELYHTKVRCSQCALHHANPVLEGASSSDGGGGDAGGDGKDEIKKSTQMPSAWSTRSGAVDLLFHGSSAAGNPASPGPGVKEEPGSSAAGNPAIQALQAEWRSPAAKRNFKRRQNAKARKDQGEE